MLHQDLLMGPMVACAVVLNGVSTVAFINVRSQSRLIAGTVNDCTWDSYPTPNSPRCFARQDGVSAHTAWHVFLVNKSFTKHNYIGEGNLILATEKVSFTPAKHRCVAVTGMATREEMWALCASASGFSSEVWTVLDLKIVLAWLLVSETQNRRDFFTKGDTFELHQLAVHLSVVCTIQQLRWTFCLTEHTCVSLSYVFRLVQIVNMGLRSHMTELDLTDSEVEKINPSAMTYGEVMSS